MWSLLSNTLCRIYFFYNKTYTAFSWMDDMRYYLLIHVQFMHFQKFLIDKIMNEPWNCLNFSIIYITWINPLCIKFDFKSIIGFWLKGSKAPNLNYNGLVCRLFYKKIDIRLLIFGTILLTLTHKILQMTFVIAMHLYKVLWNLQVAFD